MEEENDDGVRDSDRQKLRRDHSHPKRRATRLSAAVTKCVLLSMAWTVPTGGLKMIICKYVSLLASKKMWTTRVVIELPWWRKAWRRFDDSPDSGFFRTLDERNIQNTLPPCHNRASLLAPKM